MRWQAYNPAARTPPPHLWEYYPWVAEVRTMSIQIRDMANPAAKAEVCGRIMTIITLAMDHRAVGDGHRDDDVPVADRLREEVQALHIALLGYAATGEDLRRMIPE